MAIDGIGILDSDLAYDVYNHIMEMYHNGESIEQIGIKIKEFNSSSDEMDGEIFTAACALAMWEIGGLTNEQMQAVRDIISKGASSIWKDISPDAQKQRQRVLSQLLQKIEQPNQKIKKRKKYKKISNVLFSRGEILAVHVNNRYRCVIFERFYQHRNDGYYSFVVTTYNSGDEPSAETVLYEEIPVTKKVNGGEYGIRTLDIDYKFIEEHKSAFLKAGIVSIDPQSINSGFCRQVSGFNDLQDMEWEMDDILLGEKAELFVCCLF
ncbi:hypothetical protein GPL15_17955 [Clostridium sp. MCC353]|uniref:hypothetical protein n=1 Tax=Clostridium sp. MCC353 TaxID=2592646 RepID=UPI001C031485|nr:hypothetical protein [Clostridium sp. MCC353]MBT9778385.1 hypothetical protein [Clostridium sp. MCC353]